MSNYPHKVRTEMYQSKTVTLASLMLDPNNPRLAIHTAIDDVTPDEHVEATQSSLLKQYHYIAPTKDAEDGGVNIRAIMDSISTIGYQPIDQIVVRQLEGQQTYLVVEGNRRVASIKHLLIQHDAGQCNLGNSQHGKLHDDICNTLKQLEVIVLDTEGIPHDKVQTLTNQILGIRHHQSLLEWEPLPRSQNIYTEYMLDLREQHSSIDHNDFHQFHIDIGIQRNVACRLSIRPGDVSKALKSYIAYRQLREKGFKVLAKHFSLLQEIVSNSILNLNYLNCDDNYFYDDTSLGRLDNIAEFEQREISGSPRILNDTKAVKKLSELIKWQLELKLSAPIRELSQLRFSQVTDPPKAVALEAAWNEIKAAIRQEQWLGALQRELELLEASPPPLSVEDYGGIGNAVAKKQLLWRVVKRVKMDLEIDFGN